MRWVGMIVEERGLCEVVLGENRFTIFPHTNRKIEPEVPPEPSQLIALKEQELQERSIWLADDTPYRCDIRLGVFSIHSTSQIGVHRGGFELLVDEYDEHSTGSMNLSRPADNIYSRAHNYRGLIERTYGKYTFHRRVYHSVKMILNETSGSSTIISRMNKIK